MRFIYTLPVLATLASQIAAAPVQVTKVVYVTAEASTVIETVGAASTTSSTTSSAEPSTTDDSDSDSGSGGNVGVVVSQYVEVSGSVTKTYATTYTTTYGAEASTTAESTTAESTTAAASTTVAASTTAEETTADATTATSSTATSTSSSDFKDAILNQHNVKRALHGVVDLVWNDTLEEYAQNYADAYDCSGTLTHSGGSYGENLGLGYTTTGVVDAWYDEISDYDSSDPVASHYTQVVWKATTELGCAKKYCDSYWGQYTICSYQTAGNVIGYFAENVLPLV